MFLQLLGAVDDVAADEMILDAGPATVTRLESVMDEANTLIYTFELPEFDAAGKPHGFLLPASSIIRVFGLFGLFGIFLFPQVGRQLMTGFSTLASKLPKA